MNKIKNILTKNKKYTLIGGAAVLILLFIIFGRGNDKTELYTVGMADVSQSVVLSGKVQTSDRADLGFAASGRVANVFVKNNQAVAQGAALAQLEIGDLLADLKIKQANLRASDVDLEAAKEELDRVTKQENTKVESAYRKLLSADLTLVPQDNDYDVEAPSIGGIYAGTTEGQYKVSIKKENISADAFTLLTFNLEKTNKILNEQGPTQLGTKGLYISFPVTELDPYLNTTWYLDIPNKNGASYVANYNAYNEAKEARDLAVQSAEFKYKKLLTEGDNGNSSVAQAEVQKIQAEIRKNTIYAPFSGKVTSISKEVGESASVGERIISILGEEKLEVVLQVSELDVSRIPADSPIKITLDAFAGETFQGILKTINSRETEIDGVPVYEAFVELPSDIRIKTGMSANGEIVLATKSGVLAIPAYLVEKKNGLNTVEVEIAPGKTETRNVTLGLLGTDSMVEIISGLAAGDKVVSKPIK